MQLLYILHIAMHMHMPCTHAMHACHAHMHIHAPDHAHAHMRMHTMHMPCACIAHARLGGTEHTERISEQSELQQRYPALRLHLRTW